MFVLIGVMLGYLSATISESYFHMFFGHPYEAMRKLYFKNTRFFKACLKPYYQHYVIHHHKTFLNHFFNQFDNKKQKKKVDKWIDHNFDKDFKNLIWIERYNLTLKGLSGTLPFAGPFCIGPIIIYNFLGLEAFLGCLITAYIPVWMSKYIHPLLHAPEETYKHSTFIQWFMKTKYMEKVLLNHFLHHHDGSKNFNLLLGGDQLIGLYRRGSDEELTEYKELLKEFKYKINLKEEIKTYSNESIDNFINRDLINKYCQNKNPSTEIRYAFQKENFENAEKVFDSHWDFESFGMSLYDKNIDFKEWSNRDEFCLSAYDFKDGVISYRDNNFKVGDVLLSNQNSDADGLFSTLLEREINFAHAALFCMLEWRSRLLPSVIEINEHGTRAVPLKVFLSNKFNSYIEIYRLEMPLSENFEKQINEKALHFLSETHAFDIYQDREQSNYLNCARTVELIYHRAGINLNIGNSRYHKATYTNLHTLGIEDSIGKNLLMPDDYALDEAFSLKGVVINNQFLDMLSRNLVRNYIQYIWRTKKLTKDLFPAFERFQYFMISQIQKNNMLSKIILIKLGMKFEDFPYGPPVFLSLISFGDNKMIEAVQIIRKELELNWDKKYKDLTWNELLNNSHLRAQLELSTKSFSKIFISDLDYVNNKSLSCDIIGSQNVIQ